MIKAIAITSSFFIAYSFEFGLRVYEFASKSQVAVLADSFGTVGICCNTLMNSIVLLKYDGSVQSSALELLGLDKWWRGITRVKSANKMQEANIPMEQIKAKQIQENGQMPDTRNVESIETRDM